MEMSGTKFFGIALLALTGCALRAVGGINIRFVVLLPNHTVNPNIDSCPTLMSTRAEEKIVLKSMENFTWSGSVNNVSIQIIYHDSQCSDYYGPMTAMEIFYRNMANILYGPCCKYALSPVGRYAKRWQVPIITPGGLVQAFSNRGNFPYLTRFMSSYDKLSDFFKNYIMDRYSWKHLSFIYHENLQNKDLGYSPCSKQVESLRQVLALNTDFSMESALKGPNTYKFYPEVFDEEIFDRLMWNTVLKGIRHNSRVVVLCASPDWVREIMLKAADMNFDNGEYVFINIDLFGNQLEHPWYRNNDSDERNEKARRIYDYLMTITLRKPDSDRYREFSAEVKKRARQEYGEAIDNNKEVNSFVGAFHDAVILYALALNETLAAGYTATDGAEVTKRMWNRTFEGITGTVSIDEFGDRQADYSLLAMNATGSFEVVANYYGNKKRYEEVPGKSIRWGGDRTSPPPDVPKCGFDGLGCKQKDISYIIVASVFVTALVIAFSATFIIYKLRAKNGKKTAG